MFKFLLDFEFFSDDIGNISIDSFLKKSVFPVYRVKNQANKLFSLKVYDQAHSSWFETAASLKDLSHKNLIKVHKVYEKGNTINKSPSILMEYAPHGDLFQILTSKKVTNDETLARTFFHQIVAGLEHMHKNNIFHLDMKPENIVMGEDMNLKIIDFDTAVQKKKSTVGSKGTKNYRAPEIINKNCQDPASADMYSLGVIFFILVTGLNPYHEDSNLDVNQLFDSLMNTPREYFTKLSKLNPLARFTEDFKELFLGLVKSNPRGRFSIEEVKKSVWFNGKTYSNEQIKKLF